MLQGVKRVGHFETQFRQFLHVHVNHVLVEMKQDGWLQNR
jgi:hypothetical protein